MFEKFVFNWDQCFSPSLTVKLLSWGQAVLHVKVELCRTATGKKYYISQYCVVINVWVSDELPLRVQFKRLICGIVLFVYRLSVCNLYLIKTLSCFTIAHSNFFRNFNHWSQTLNLIAVKQLWLLLLLCPLIIQNQLSCKFFTVVSVLNCAILK